MRRHRDQIRSYVGVFDGATQYFSKTSPSKMDLDGDERITNANNRDFEVNVGDWTDAGTHAITRSTTDKRTGTASGKIIASGVGDATTNYVTIAASTFTTLVLGEKYTLELWATSETATTTISAIIGTATVASGTLSTTPGTFTKVVLNFQAAAGDITQPLRVYLSKAATVYIDDVSLTQAYDAVWTVWIKTSNSAGNQRFFSKRTTSGWLLFTSVTTGLYKGLVQSDATSITAESSIAITDGRWHFLSMTADRTGNLSLYLDGILNGTPQSISSLIGKIVVDDELRVGMDDSLYLNGSLGEMSMVRFNSLPTGIASWIAYASTQRFIPEPPGGGETVLRIFGRRNDAYDQSGNQGVLTNTGSTPIIAR